MKPSSIPTSLPGTLPNPLTSIAGPISFDGKSTTDNLGSLSQLLSSTFTIAMWVTTTTLSGKQFLVSYGRDSSNYVGEFEFYLDTAGRLNFMDYGSAGYGFGSSSAGALSTSSVTSGTRTHVAFVRNGLQGTFYINGVSAGSVTSTRSVTYTNKSLCLGADIRDFASYFSGTMDLLKIFNVALTSSQISTVYASTS